MSLSGPGIDFSRPEANRRIDFLIDLSSPNDMLQHLLMREVRVPPPRDPVIPVDISTADPPDARKSTPTMHNAPVIKDQDIARLQLDPALHLLPLQDLVPLARSLVPAVGTGRYNAPVVVVPSDAVDGCVRILLVFRFDDRVEFVWGDGDAVVSTGVPRYARGMEALVQLRGLGLQDACRVESVDEERFAAIDLLARARAFVGQHMEGLQTRWFGEVCGVSMGGQS